MERVQGRIEKDGLAAIDDVDVTLHVHDPAVGLKSWAGAFVTDHEHDVRPGEEYRLVLEDGRAGSILITNITIRSGTDRVPVAFVGSGPLV